MPLIAYCLYYEIQVLVNRLTACLDCSSETTDTSVAAAAEILTPAGYVYY